MDAQKYNRTITLMCPTCGGTQFESEDEAPEGMVQCKSCGLSLTRDELRDQNGEHIAANLEEVKKAVVNDLTKSFRDAFKGNKNFRIK